MFAAKVAPENGLMFHVIAQRLQEARYGAVFFSQHPAICTRKWLEMSWLKAGSSLTEAGFASIDAAFPGGVATSEDSIVEDLELLKGGFKKFHRRRHLEMTNVGFTWIHPMPFASIKKPSPFHHHFYGSYEPNSNHHPQSW